MHRIDRLQSTRTDARRLAQIAREAAVRPRVREHGHLPGAAARVGGAAGRLARAVPADRLRPRLLDAARRVHVDAAAPRLVGAHRRRARGAGGAPPALRQRPVDDGVAHGARARAAVRPVLPAGRPRARRRLRPHRRRRLPPPRRREGPAGQGDGAALAARHDAVVGAGGEGDPRADLARRREGRVARLARQGLGPDLQGRRRAEAAARRHVGIERLLLRRRGREPHDAAAAGAPPRHLLLRALPPAADLGVGGGLGRGRAQQLEGVVGRRPRRARRPPPPLARRGARRGAAGGGLLRPARLGEAAQGVRAVGPLRRRLHERHAAHAKPAALLGERVVPGDARGDGHAVGPLGGARRAPRLWTRLVHRTRGVRHHALQPRVARVRRRGAAHVERAAARPVRPRALVGDRLSLRSGTAQREPVVRRRRLRASRALRSRDRGAAAALAAAADVRVRASRCSRRPAPRPRPSRPPKSATRRC